MASERTQEAGESGLTRMVAILFFTGMAPGFWYPTMNNILRERGWGAWVPLAFLAPPIAAMLAPVMAGALADHRIQAQKLLGITSLLGAGMLAAAFGVLQHGGSPLLFLAVLLCFCVVTAPNWGLATTVVLANLRNAERTFPLVRIGGTVGWMAAGLIVSHVLRADASPVAGYGGAVAMLAAAVVSFGAPPTLPRGGGGGWRVLLGADALRLLRQPDQRVFFLTTALIAVPLVSFYMHAPAHLKDLGDPHPAATMAIGQMVEVAGLLVISRLMDRYRLKVLLGWALLWFVVRYLLFMVAGLTGQAGWMMPGVALQGVCYTLYFITAQVFLDRRVAAGVRGQAQGLLSTASGGLGALVGALFTGWLHRVTVDGGAGGWPLFWGVLAAMLAACSVYFWVGYQGRGASPDTRRQPQPGAADRHEPPVFP